MLLTGNAYLVFKGILCTINMIKIVGIKVQKLIHKDFNLVHLATLLSLDFLSIVTERERDYLPNRNRK